jgi:hypothetical protein
MNVLVCDDDQALCDEIAHNIQDAIGEKPRKLVGKDLTDVLTGFFKDIKRCLNFNAPENCEALAANPFDESIVILDNNLTLLDVPGAPLTAESVAGYLRAFTRADYVISLNLNPDVDFDLRYLVGDFSTRADLALNTHHLANRALWTGKRADAKDGFLPWYWPTLGTVVAKRRKQIAFVRDHLDDSVLPSLDFDSNRTGLLSAHALGALSPTAEPEGAENGGMSPEEISFRHVFVARDRSLPVRRERENLASATGNEFVRDIIVRAVAADIDFWFRRDIVGPQEPLVDLPHLMSRLPFLLGKQAKDLKGWNKCLDMRGPPFSLNQQMYEGHLAPAKYKHELWVPNACFWWHELKSDEKLDELFFLAEEGDWADVVFCEDQSSFAHRESTMGESPIEFPGEFESAWGRRYVAYIDGYQYAPRSRLAS